jgi:hypothetical protein
MIYLKSPPDISGGLFSFLIKRINGSEYAGLQSK